MIEFRCSNCGAEYPKRGMPYKCPVCGGTFDIAGPLPYDPVSGRGLSRFVSTFPLPPGHEFISLGEGGTPLLSQEMDGRRVYFKCEYFNPTGSFKDRGMAVLVNALVSEGVEEAIEDSSGNAGSSFAAYAARAGIHARVFTPDYASGVKRAQIEAYGAELIPIPGPRSAATEAAHKEVAAGAVYASHAHHPHGMTGYATLAFELVEQLGEVPGALVVPAGQGTQLLGAYHGFRALQTAGVIEELPRLVGVQAEACAPLWAVHLGGPARLDWVTEGETVAEGIRIVRPLRGDAVLRAVESTDGTFVAVKDRDILAGRAALAQRGLMVEPTSAVVWPALNQTLNGLRDPVVAVLTGTGLKAPWPTRESAAVA